MAREKLMCRVFSHEAGKAATLRDGTQYFCHQSGSFMRYRSHTEWAEKIVRAALKRCAAPVRILRVDDVTPKDAAADAPRHFIVQLGREAVNLPIGSLLHLLAALPANCGTARVLREVARPVERWPRGKAEMLKTETLENTDEPTEQTGTKNDGEN